MPRKEIIAGRQISVNLAPVNMFDY